MFKLGKRRIGVIMGTLIATSTLLTSTTAFGDGARLTGDALKQAVSGKTFTGATSRGGTWESTYQDGGAYKVVVLNSDWSDSGSWKIENDEVCSERTKRSRMCYQVTQTGSGEFEWLDERRQTTKSSYAR